MKKIAIDGSQSTGKTTVFEQIKSLLDGNSDIHFIEEMAGVVAKNEMNVKTAKDWEMLLNDRERYNLFVSLLVAKQTEKESAIPFISDSSLYRIYAYAMENGVDITEAELTKVKYDLVLYCPIEFEFVHNDFRSIHLRESVNERLLGLIKKYHKGKFLEIKGSIEERQKVISKIVSTGLR
jgi:nicotinamide riboside kinase